MCKRIGEDMSDSLVSVIIPAYNRAYCIETSIRSVLEQSYSNIEVIVVDDCSKDNTEEVIRNISDDRIVYEKNEQNLGAAGSRNKGAQLAKGKYLAFNDSDDLWSPNKLQLQMEELEKLDAQMVYCRFRRCHKNGETVTIIPDESQEKECLEGDIYSLMLEKNVISPTTVVIHKSLFDSLGGFNSKMKALEDYELFLKAAKEVTISFVDEVLVETVDYGDGINDASTNALANIKAIALMANEFEGDIETYKVSNSFKSNLPFFVQHLEKEDWNILETEELKFVASELKAYMQVLYNQIDLLETTIQRLNEWHEEKDKTIQQLNEWNAEKDTTIQQLNEWNWEKDRTIQQLNEWHEEKDKTIQQLNEWHWEKDKTIQQLNEWHEEKDKTIQQLNEWHWEKDKTIQQLNEWHWEKDRHIKELEERLKEYEK
jgi:glycosyltransferase involved in cell wall biosynthesis